MAGRLGRHGPAVGLRTNVPTMSQRRPKALGVVLAMAVATTLMSVAPAQSREAEEHPADPTGPPATITVRAKASGPNHFNSSVDVNIPAGGSATIESPDISPAMKKAGLDITTTDTDGGLLETAAVLLQLPTPQRRLLACLSMSAQAVMNEEAIAQLTGTLDAYEAVAQTRFLLRITTCLYVASLVAEYLANPNARSALLAGTPCNQAAIGIKEKVTRSDGAYHLTSKGRPSAKKKNAQVKIKCKVVSANKISMVITPRKKGKTLRSVLGRSLVLGLETPNSSTSSLPVKVAFTAL